MNSNNPKIESIRSNYILKVIFHFISRKKNLNIINYNKSIQKRLGINIDDYKKEGNRYKIGERNGLGKEYNLDTNKLLFEGEYLNGKKNGKGKEYYENGKLNLKVNI